MDEAGKGRTGEGKKRKDETGGRNGSGQWYCPEIDEAGKGENKEGKDETGGRNGSGQWYCTEMDEAGKGRTGEGKKREDETGAGNDIALKWTKPEKEERGKDETGG